MFITFGTDNSLNRIEDYAYFGNTELTEFTVTSDTGVVGAGAFSGCTQLSDLVFEQGCSEIGEGAFFGCSSLREVRLPMTLNEVGDHAFSACSSLESIWFDASPANIGKGVFQGCRSLESINITEDEEGGTGGRFCTVDGVLFSKGRDGALTLEIFPQGRSGAYRTPENVRFIADGAFRGCTQLEKVTLGLSVERIGSRAFAGCKDIHIEIENREIETGQLPFEETANVSLSASGKKKSPFARFDEPDFEEKLANIKYVFPVNKKFVVPAEKWSFNKEDGRAEVVSYNGDEAAITVPAHADDLDITRIGDYAFSPERGGIDRKRREILAKIRSVFMARSITAVGTGAFKNCSSLEYALVPGSVSEIGDRAFSGCSSLEAVTLPPELDRIGNGVFFGCRKLENIEIPETVQEIGDLAFSGCEHITYISIPEGVKKIGRKAFAGCRYLMYITFPDSLEEVGMDAFKDTLWFSGRPEGVVYAGKCAAGYKGQASAVRIAPGTVSVSPAAFRGNEWINAILVPDGVKSIGDEAFFGCSKLDNVVIPESVTDIGGHTFAACRMLRKIRLPQGITRIPEFMFSGCTALKDIHLPESVKVIERAAFRSCTNLKEINIPDGCQRIDDEAFIGCGSLTEIHIPDSVTDIGERAFAQLPALIIRAHAGSQAEEYARLNHMRFLEETDQI